MKSSWAFGPVFIRKPGKTKRSPELQNGMELTSLCFSRLSDENRPQSGRGDDGGTVEDVFAKLCALCALCGKCDGDEGSVLHLLHSFFRGAQQRLRADRRACSRLHPQIGDD